MLFGGLLSRRRKRAFTLLTPGAQSFTVPRWATSMDVVCWGGGGAGEGGIGSYGGTGGSRAAKSGVTVTPNSTLTVYVGAGGTVSGGVPLASSEATYVEISSGNRLTAAGGANYPAYSGAASAGTGVFASPTLTTGSTGGQGTLVSFTVASQLYEFITVGNGGDAAGPDGGTGGGYIDTDADSVPDTDVPPQQPGGAGPTLPYFYTIAGSPVNTGGEAAQGAAGGVTLRFYP